MQQTMWFDVVFGTAATLLAAVLTYQLKNVKLFKIPMLSIFMPVIVNGVIIGAELAIFLAPADEFLMFAVIFGLEVAAGELLAVILGYFVINALKKSNLFED